MRKFLKKLEVTNITNLTNYQIDKLEVGDVVAKKTNGMYHHYIVSYKENNVGMCLTYTDASVVETVSYDYVEGNWVYNSTDILSPASKLYVDTLMSGALKRAIVETLPTEDIDTNTIYMVLDATAAQGNVYNEYLYIEEAWELIGTTEVQTQHLYRHEISLTSSLGTLKAVYYNEKSTAYDQAAFVTKYGSADYVIPTNVIVSNSKIVYGAQCQSTNPNNIYMYATTSTIGQQSDFVSTFTDTVTQIF